MNDWLQNIACRTPVDIGIFIFAAVLASVIVGLLTAISANANPNLSLCHE